MKYLLIPLALVAGSAMACPADGSKDASAPASSKPVDVAKAAAPTSAMARAAATAKPVTQVATKPANEPRKSAPL